MASMLNTLIVAPLASIGVRRREAVLGRGGRLSASFPGTPEPGLNIVREIARLQQIKRFVGGESGLSRGKLEEMKKIRVSGTFRAQSLKVLFKQISVVPGCAHDAIIAS